MKRIAFEVGLVVAVIVLGLEAIAYRNAVLDCNVDRKRAWKTVLGLRDKLAAEDGPAAGAPAHLGDGSTVPAAKSRPSGDGAR